MDHISNTQSWKDNALPPFQGAQHGPHQPHGNTHNTKTARGTKVNKLVDTQISRDKVVGTASLHTSCKWHGSMRRCCLVVAGGTSSCLVLASYSALLSMPQILLLTRTLSEVLKDWV